jgi:hypothetical protein
MKKIVISAMLLLTLLAGTAGQALANHDHPRIVKGANCGGQFKNADACSFRYQGGQLYLGGSVRGSGLPAGFATIRLEANSHVTGERRILLSCTTASGGCAAGGSYDSIEHIRKGQKIFCIVEGVGRGNYECGTLLRKR